jgi:phospholipase C
MKRWISSVLLAVGLTVAGCSASGGGRSMPVAPEGSSVGSTPHAQSQKIQHVVILIQENRSFDNLFATYPGADGATVGRLHNGKNFKLIKGTLVGKELEHIYPGYLIEYDGGKMDGFDQIFFGSTGNPSQPAGKYPLRYVKPEQIKPYWAMAQNYALADHMFQTQGSGSFTAHQELIAAGTAINSTDSLIDLPSNGPWGCDAPPSTLTTYITTSGQYFFNTGPYPCLRYKTLKDLLDPKGVSWKYYTPPLCQPGTKKPSCQGIGSGFLWNAFDAIHNVRYGPDWKANDVSPETTVFNDISANKLPAVSWVIPCGTNSDHASPTDNGPSWVAGVVNAIGKSPAWKSTVILVVWDDWGGYFDHVPPAFIDNQGGLGFRVPMIAISPYSKNVGYISHTQYEFGSIVRFVEDNWQLGRLGATDVRATSVADMFDFTKPPRAFVPIQSPQWTACSQGDTAPDDE